MSKTSLFSSLVIFAIASIVATAPVSSQTRVADKFIAKANEVAKKLQEACSADIKTYCSKVTPGDGRLVFCFMAHEDKVSDRCYNKFFDVAEGITLAASNVWRAADACASDIDKYCANVSEGQGRIAQCLIDKKSKVSSSCRAEMAGIESRLKK